MVSSSPSATNTDFPSLETAIPRGRCPVGIVATVSILSVSTTEMELPFSFETKARKAEAGSALSSKSVTQRLPNAVLAIADMTSSPLEGTVDPFSRWRGRRRRNSLSRDVHSSNALWRRLRVILGHHIWGLQSPWPCLGGGPTGMNFGHGGAVLPCGSLRNRGEGRTRGERGSGGRFWASLLIFESEEIAVS